MNFRKLMLTVVSALMIWKSLMFITHSEVLVTVVLTADMEPAYYRGDILLSTFYENDPVLAGDLVVFTLNSAAFPIVHRVIISQEKADGDYYILTKGDYNPQDDRALYNAGQYYLHKSDLTGRVRGYVPYIGMVIIFLNDFTNLWDYLMIILNLQLVELE